ncbi:hypothetical protein NB640_00585 [Oxalobacter vibrioformis]|uniref:Haloacid dehalogenase-like hydrolase n=1 Tax=Oxalobacter vibrioformis TaxID=933080 RepID=A0A9E9P4K1_9BURK|nr:hypothetical protein [Oxalobacter vibrioformis]WAW10201.1 hypothetical protein NB640_00585 [Oxalobacter vibrioformis]
MLPQIRYVTACLLAIVFFPLFSSVAWAQTDPLPSWTDLPAKQRIMAFVRQTVTPDSPGYLPEAERIAVFDNDGTLWVEQPVYAQMV